MAVAPPLHAKPFAVTTAAFYALAINKVLTGMSYPVHYCWFGPPDKMGMARKYCIKTWSKHIPDRQLMFWHEENCQGLINSSYYAKKCLKQKMYAFLADYIRFVRLYQYGGIYLDTDVEIIKNIAPLGRTTSFFLERNETIGVGVVISAKKSPIIGEIIKEYENKVGVRFVYEVVPKLVGRVVTTRTKSLIKDMTTFHYEGELVKVLPKEYFYPYDPYDSNDEIRQRPFYGNVTENTYGIHHWFKGWNLGITQRARQRIRNKLSRLITRTTEGKI